MGGRGERVRGGGTERAQKGTLPTFRVSGRDPEGGGGDLMSEHRSALVCSTLTARPATE